ncbi:Uncharacterised protein [Shewanella morhuae]|uniref:Uncharacterized protein n=1 Tax=Shewanella morhuae TaxID=365591 RepID=A0A380A763_9GAMM|nr:Uncharacterised protein [Shewanella morhuae]
MVKAACFRGLYTLIRPITACLRSLFANTGYSLYYKSVQLRLRLQLQLQLQLQLRLSVTAKLSLAINASDDQDYFLQCNVQQY